MTVQAAYESLFTSTLLFMAVVILAALIRCIKGSETADRILAVNMLGTAVTVTILVLSLLLDQPYLGDVALVYVLINFISVAILAKVYIPLRNHSKKEDKEDGR